MAVPTVQLGEYEVPVPAQRIGRMENELRSFFADLSQTDVQGLSVADDVGGAVLKLGREKAYDMLCMVVPMLAKRMPRWEFAGYSSAEAMEAGEYDETQDTSPTWPQIRAAFETAKKVNEFDFLDGAKSLVKGLYAKADPTLVGQAVNVVLSEMVLWSSQNSALPSGASASTSSTTNGRTTPVSVA